MHRYDESNGSGFALGLIAGAVTGAGLALLFAPKAGHALRTDLVETVDRLRSAIAERYEDLAARAGVELENFEDTVDTAAQALESHAKAAVQTAARRVRAMDPGAV